MLTAVFSGFGLSIAAPWIYRVGRGATGWILALLPTGLFIYFATLAPRIAAGERIAAGSPWAPSLGVSLSFSVDGLSLLFVLLIDGIGALILIYAGAYLVGNYQLDRFYAFLLLFMGAMQGLVLADNLLTLFVFWELTSISSFLLIGFDHERKASRAAAIQALLVTGGGGLALLAGVLLMGLAGGSFELSVLLTRGEVIRADPHYLPILLLVLAGAFTKSAQAPFHFWLPSAMEAPTPVSAYLHSATMVKAGIYLLARLSPILAGTNAWTLIVTTVGAATMVTGGAIAFYQTDLKRLLAYSTISALGTLVMLLGLGSTTAIEAAMVFLLVHAVYKGAMFLVAGIVDHETGTRDVEQLRGLRRAMPVTALIAALAALSMASFGPVVGFIGKELMLEAVLAAGQASAILTPVAVFAGALFVTVATLVGIRPFVGEPQPTPQPAHEASVSMRLGPAILALAGLVIGLAPGGVGSALVAPAVSAVLGQPETVDLHLWAGFTPALALSLLSFVLGLVLYTGWAALRRTTAWVETIFRWGPARWYDLALVGVARLAHTVTGLLQSGHLRNYLLITMVSTVSLVGATLVGRNGLPRTLARSDMRLYEVGIAAMILLAAVASVFARSRLGAVAILSVVGSGIGVFYVLYSAPDLAMTQVLVETLTVLLYVFVFFYLPGFTIRSTRTARTWDAIVAIATGGLMTALVLAATATPPESRLAPFYAETSKTVAHGSNIVNVILVDFRSLDTLGEITVLSAAAIGVFALLKLRLRKGKEP